MSAAGGATGTRREARRDAVRVVEYTRFPRVDADAGPRFAFTRDLSASGMCVGCDAPESVGSLLRVAVRELGGLPSSAEIGRVVWCQPAGDGRFWLGLEQLPNS